jgi:hypothetical protein
MMRAMARPTTSSRIVLVEDRRGAGDAPAVVVPLRRYRLARLRLNGRPAPSAGRFEYLKRTHD